MKKRTKYILSRRGTSYKVVLNNELVQIVFLSKNPLHINSKKREIQNILNFKGWGTEMEQEDKKSVTYVCPIHLQKLFLKVLAKT